MITGVRATIHIAAPGENEVLAAYNGPTGSYAEGADPTKADDPNWYFTGASGTSFASPTVAGGVSLLKDASYGSPSSSLNSDQARDTRVIRSVLMAGAVATVGWNNGQKLENGVISTTQSLDYQTGAGAMNLARTNLIYTDVSEGTTDVLGTGGGIVSSHGWDFGSVNLDGHNDYIFDQAFTEATELTLSLNWFVTRSFDNLTDTAAEGSFADLNLEVWSIVDGNFDHLVAESDSLYNNSEFLRFLLPEDGTYGFRVTFDGIVYDLDNSLTAEDYGVAWEVGMLVPEPSTWALLGVVSVALLFFRRRRKASN
jgi:hypothetical protein